MSAMSVPWPPPLPAADVRSVSSVLLHGTFETRRALAEQLLHADDTRWWLLLAATVRSEEEVRLRARCLEVLGLCAGAASQATSERIISSLLEPDSPPPA